MNEIDTDLIKSLILDCKDPEFVVTPELKEQVNLVFERVSEFLNKHYSGPNADPFGEIPHTIGIPFTELLRIKNE